LKNNLKLNKMGTRNLTMVISNEETKISQYGQWDGYPEGNGITILNFLEQVDLEKFKEKLNKVRFMNDQDDKKLEDFLARIGAKDGWMNSGQSDLFKKEYPYLSRDVGSDILELIYKSDDGGEILLRDSTEFAGDGLFCEWAYVIDLDKNSFEVYKGFNKEPLSDDERFNFLQNEEGYTPVKFVTSFSLTELPGGENFIEIINDIVGVEEEEEED
jgi:hypothetical protein